MKKLSVLILILLFSVACNAEIMTVFLEGQIVPPQLDEDNIYQGGTFDWVKYQIQYETFQMYMREQKVTEIIVVIASNGGCPFEAWKIYNYLNDLKGKGIKVKTVANALCMSAAVIVLQVGEPRLAYKHTTFMTHRVYFGPLDIPFVKEKDLQEMQNDLARETEKMMGLFTEKTGLPKEVLEQYITDKEYYFNADEAYKLGFIDSIPITSIKDVLQPNQQGIEIEIKEEN